MTVTTGESLTAIRECLAALPAAVLWYDTDGFDASVDMVSDREATCDGRKHAVVERACPTAPPRTPASCTISQPPSTPDATEDLADHLLFVQGGSR